MVILPISDLVTPLTPAQIKSKYYSILAKLGVNTTMWKPGGVERLIIAVFSILCSTYHALVASFARSAFLATADGAWARVVARGTFGTEYQPATFASGYVTFVNAQGGSHAFAADECRIANSDGHEYTNTSAFTVAANATVNGVPFRATESGAASSSGVGTITSIVTTMTGVTCANTTAFVGSDEESTALLRTRALLKPQSLSPNGPSAAYEFFARNAVRQDGTSIGVTRATVTPYSTTGKVYVTVATASGGVSGSSTDPSTDLGAIYLSILKNALTQCVELTVLSATAKPFDLSIACYWADGTSVPNAQQYDIAFGALSAWLAALPIGGVSVGPILHTVSVNTMRDILSQAIVAAGYARPSLIVLSTSASGGGDITLTESQVATLRTLTVTT
jgi:hypothetical protein